MKQQTIAKSATIRGVGLHTGKQVTVTFKPAPANHGCSFQRIDLEKQPIVPVHVNFVIDTTRGTTIQKGNARVSTVEHALSAIAGVKIDNLLIEIDGPELPILDGSAAPFIQLFEEAGIAEQEAVREYITITEPITYRDDTTGTELLALPADEFEVQAMIDFNSPVLGHQFATLKGIENYQTEIAPSRTFVFLHEIEKLFDQNLIQGGDFDNAVIIVDRVMGETDLAKLAKKLGKKQVEVVREGVLNNTALRFPNEPARHKLLDIIGDLCTVGLPIKGKIIATKPGHTANIAFAKKLRTFYEEHKKAAAIPKYNPAEPPLYDINQIAGLLPHRYPFLLVDKIIELSENHVVGVKNVTMNEGFFQGHFPENPIFPGVLQIEAMAQTGGILALSQQEDPGNWDTYFLKIDNARFKQKVIPGDTLLLKLELIAPIRRGIVQMQATAYVGDKIVSEGTLTAQIARRTSE